MKNIFEILAALGIVIPEDKKQDITKQVAENYKTVAAVSYTHLTLPTT